MRAILSLLLCFVFMQSQVFAAIGGPDYNLLNKGVAGIVGTYAGVLTETNVSGSTPSGSVALFSLSIPKTGYGTGSTIVFSQGRVFRGTITGVGSTNAKKGSTFKGIIEAGYTYNISQVLEGEKGQTLVTIPVDATANGVVNAGITSNSSSNSFNVFINGTATLQVSAGQVDGDGSPIILGKIDYDLSGYRQSAAAPSTGVSSGSGLL